MNLAKLERGLKEANIRISICTGDDAAKAIVESGGYEDLIAKAVAETDKLNDARYGMEERFKWLHYCSDFHKQYRMELSFGITFDDEGYACAEGAVNAYEDSLEECFIRCFTLLKKHNNIDFFHLMK